jgi:hypothetical protein
MLFNTRLQPSKPLTRLASLSLVCLLTSCGSLTATKTQPIILDPPQAIAASSAKASGTVPLSVGYCDNARPILWSKKMSDSQIRQIKEHNAVYHRLCG